MPRNHNNHNQMGSLQWFVLFLIVLFFLFKRLLLYALNLIFTHKLKIEVRLGQVALLPPSVQNTYFFFKNFTVHIDKVRLTSSLVNAETKRLLGLLIEDVRFTRDSYTNATLQLPTQNHNETSRINLLEKVLPILTSFVQFMCVTISNVTVVAQLKNGQLVHASVNNLSLDGSILPRSQIALCVLVDAFSCRLLQTVASNDRIVKVSQVGSDEARSKVWQPCLADFSVGVQSEIHVDPFLPAITKVMLNVSNPRLSVNDRLLKLIGSKEVFEDEPRREKQQFSTWSPYFPRKCDFTITGTEIKLYRNDDESLYLSSTLNSLELTADTTLDNGVVDNPYDTNIKLHSQMLFSETKSGRWFSISELDATIQIFSGNIDSTVNASRIAVVYTNVELLPWISLIPKKKKKIRSERSPIESSRQTPLTLNFEIWDLSAVAVFQDALPLRSGITHVQLQLVDHPATGGLSCEFEAETVWCCLGNRTPSDPSQQKVHFWNSPIYVGLVIGKVERRLGILGMNDTIQSQLLLDVLRFEWSPNLIDTIMTIYKALPSGNKTENSPLTEKVPTRVSFALTVASANIFLLMKKEAGLVFRIDSLAADHQPDKAVFSMEGLKGLFIVPGAPFGCAKSFEIKRGNLELLRLQVTYRKSTHCGTVDVDQLGLNWDSRLHMAVLQVIEEWKTFRNHFRQPPTERNLASEKTDIDTKPSWTISLKHKTNICAVLSPKHTIQLQADDSRALVNSHPRTSLELSLPHCALSFDGHSVIEADGLVWKLADSDQELKQERLSFDCEADTNKCAMVSIAHLRVCFPYRYQFSEACQQETVSVFKWLKSLHRKPRLAGHGESLYRDIRISVALFSMTLCDDPFEVKLRDNYALREDEFREGLKRKRMLDAKIEELRRTHPLLTQGKIDELYANLGARNVEIFVKRAQRMYETRPVRTALFRWEMEQVDLIALADPSFHGYDNVVRNIQEMDPDSPWPDEPLEFTTLWCRAVRATCCKWRFLLRDFPQPLLDIHELLLFGRLAGAEQQSSWRARRTCTVSLAPPWSDVQIERGMSALKFYHDFSCDAESWRLAYGPCWEPVIAQCNLAWDFVSPPSKDPSPPLPFWDKIRLLLHGRVTLSVQQLTLLLHTSLDPYNTTEEMELTWTDLAMDWTTANFIFKGELNVYVRTASKYDDCRLLHLPRLKLTIGLTWHCLADPNDHLSVRPCAPDRVPEYSSNQEHDSYRAFRSQNVTLAVSLETKASGSSSITNSSAEVHALVYGSTLRWFENLKFILSGVSRPTRRGPLFNNTKPRKGQLSRHYKAVRLALSLHRFHIYYWMSASMQRGFELICGRLTLSSEHGLRLVPLEDGLKHRPRADWSIVFLNCELNEAEVWLQSALGSDNDDNVELNVSLRQPVEKFYFLSVQRVSYGREAVLTPPFVAPGTASIVPTHRLVVQDLRAAWTKSNRQVAFALYDSWVKAQVLKRNLSSEVMKLLRMPETTASPMKPRNSTRSAEGAQPTPCKSSSASATSTTSSSTTTVPASVADSMLQQLLADHRNVVFSEDLSSTGSRPAVTGTSTTEGQEGVHLNWLIELVNSQVLLKGCETKGYIIISAAHAKILQRLHPPVWRDRSLVSKTSWICSLDGMQYFATISAGEQDALDENILWLSTDHIGTATRAERAESQVSLDYLPDMVGSGQSVGGVISETVGGCDSSALQLQRIVSRCNCELVYVSYGQNTLDLDHDLEALMDDIPPPPSDDVMDLWAQREQPVDSFTLTHHDLNICTNSLQYEMLLDVINNLLLHVEPHRKEASERLQRLRFQLQLSSTEDQRRPVQQIQNQLRSLISQLRRLEKDTFTIQRALSEDPSNAQLLAEFDSLERKVYECKEQLNAANEELAMMVSCLKEAQLTAHQRLQAARQGSAHVTTVRTSQIDFKHAQWRLTEADGQLGIADVVLTNFLYNKLSKSDDACEHSLEIGYVSLANLLPNQIYKQVIVPTELNRNMPVDRQVAVRMFSRDKAPVGGICIKEIFEVNVVPFTFAMTYQFFKTMMRFCFPEKDPETLEGDGEHSESTMSRKGGKHFSNVNKTKRGKESSFYVPIEDKDDVEKMKERAEKNKLFIYIKIPEVPVKVSYKGGKEKNIEDVHEFSLVVPTLEYHNVTWTWLDLFLAMKNDSKRVLLSQAIKQKLQIRPRSNVEEGGTPQEEDKARLLLGGLSMPGDARSSKRGFWKPSSK